MGKVKLTLDVGYRAKYAVYVHENLQARHRVGEAKFLEKAAKFKKSQMAYTIDQTLKNKKSLEIALNRAGKILLEDSNRRVPIDTGYLRDSSFIKIR